MPCGMYACVCMYVSMCEEEREKLKPVSASQAPHHHPGVSAATVRLRTQDPSRNCA